jgi:hypothetical protein
LCQLEGGTPHTAPARLTPSLFVLHTPACDFSHYVGSWPLLVKRVPHGTQAYRRRDDPTPRALPGPPTLPPGSPWGAATPGPRLHPRGHGAPGYAATGSAGGSAGAGACCCCLTAGRGASRKRRLRRSRRARPKWSRQPARYCSTALFQPPLPEPRLQVSKHVAL